MKPLLQTVALASLVLLAIPAAAAAAAPALKKVLFFSKSATAEHAAIKAESAGGKGGYAFPVLRQLGEKNHIEFTFSKDGSLFTPEYLAQFDAYCFYTTGDLTQPAKDGSPPMTAAGKAALLQAIAAGKGFIGTHTATDTFHSPGEKNANSSPVDDYIKMIGGEFIIHGTQQPAHQIVADAKFPGVAAVPADFAPNEEWYTLKNLAPDLHVILVQDTSKMTGAMYQRPNYPSTWARMHGKGRVFYTSMGHRDDVWANPVFQAVLAGGLDWALKRVDADVTPNMSSAAPKAAQLAASIAQDKAKTPKAAKPRKAPAAN